MRRSLPGIGLAGSALLGLVLVSTGPAGGGTERPIDPAVVLRQLGVPDSIADRWVEPYIPLWALTQEAPVVGPEGPVDALTSSTTTDCPASLEIDLMAEQAAIRLDSLRGMTELYNRTVVGDNGWINRYDIANDLSYTTTVIPIDSASPWISEDLDRDGNVEIVSQWWDHLLIHASPVGTLEADFVWPGYNVEMNPALFNLDDDPFMEVYVTPHTLGGAARVVIIDYDSTVGTFVKLADIESPFNLAGAPAIGDFDEDGRMEFISSNRLFEWRDPHLVYIGAAVDTIPHGRSAVSCRPKPEGVLHALLGYSSSDAGFRYDLLAPTGDNAFEVVQTFQEETGFHGAHPCNAADTDCDGLDELVMCFYPTDRVWQWDAVSESFMEGCNWAEATYGSLFHWYVLDLDQNGAAEWGTVNTVRDFRAFPDPDCVYCDTSGQCPTGAGCFCACPADPACDDQTNVLDVVLAVDVAFRSAQPMPDPFAQCPVERTDVDCSGFTDVLDVVHLVNVAFRSADPAVELCTPCL